MKKVSHLWKCIGQKTNSLILALHHAGLDEEAVQVRGGHLTVQEEDQVQQLRWVSWRGPGSRCRCQREIKDRCEVNVKKYSTKITLLTCQRRPNNFVEIETWRQLRILNINLKKGYLIKEFMRYLLLKSIINVLDGNSKLNIMATFAVSQSI